MDLHNEILEFAKHALGIQEESAPVHMTPVTGGGSNRSFYRIRHGDNRSAIFMHYDRSYGENAYYAAIAEFLRGIGVSVPRIMAHDTARGFIVMDDLGDIDLWFYRHEPWQIRREFYFKTLTIISNLHTFPIKNFPKRKVHLMEGFGPALYQWEQDYFLENFVQTVCGLKLNPSDKQDLANELGALSQRLENTKPCLIHRDLQSRNIMIRENEPVLIDFQGMRFGNLSYDLGSLLYDPYVSLNNDERMELLQYYYILSNRDELIDWLSFQKMFQDASAQRLMQALGAYGFLGLKRGISEFLPHIPRGLANLIDASVQSKRIPRLHNLALKCQDALRFGLNNFRSYAKE